MQLPAHTLDRLAQGARRNVTRRRTAMAWGGASLVALACGPSATARNSKRKRKRNKKKCRKKSRNKANEACQQQVGECETLLARTIIPRVECCAPLATCDYAGFFACFSA